MTFLEQSSRATSPELSANKLSAAGWSWGYRSAVNARWLARKARPSAAFALFVRRFRRERGDDFLEARIAAERVPEGHQCQLPVAGDVGRTGKRNGLIPLR